MANDTPGSDTPREAPATGEARPDRSAETTFHPRPDANPYARPGSAAQPGSAQPGSAAQYGTAADAANAGRGTGYGQQAGTAPYGYGPAGGAAPYGYGAAAPGGQQASAPYAQPSPGNGTPGQYAQGAGQAGTGSYGTGGHPAYPPPPAPPRERRTGAGALVAVGLIAALVGGGVGGAVGATLTARDSGSSGVLAAPPPAIEESSAPVGEVEAVAARVLPSVVRLLVEGPAGAGEGSGMVLSADGLLLTNNHVVEAAAGGGTIVAVFQDGRTAPADLVGRDPSSDLAVIRAQGVTGLTPIELGNSDAVRVGQPVVAFGSPLGLGGSVTSGIISAVDRAVSVGEESGASEATVLSALQTDAAINPGNSGGPLTDMEGRVIGINSVIATTGQQGGSIGVGFSIPINQARRTAQELETTGRATRAVLGAGVNRGGELSGATLASIVPGGPAEAAGLRQGQVVTRVGDRMVTNGDDLIAAIRENAPGDQVTLVVDGQPVPVTLGGETG